MELSNYTQRELKLLKSAIDITKMATVSLGSIEDYKTYTKLGDDVEQALKDRKFEDERLPDEDEVKRCTVVVIDSFPVE